MPEQASRRGPREPRPRQCSRERLRAPVVTDGPCLRTEEISPLGRQTRSLDSVRLLPGRPKAQGTGVGGTGKAGDALGPHARLHLPGSALERFSTTDSPRGTEASAPRTGPEPRGDSAPWRGPAAPTLLVPATDLRATHTQLTFQALCGPAPVAQSPTTSGQSPNPPRTCLTPRASRGGSPPGFGLEKPRFFIEARTATLSSAEPPFWFVWGPRHAPPSAPVPGCALPTGVSPIHVLSPHGTHQRVSSERTKVQK